MKLSTKLFAASAFSGLSSYGHGFAAHVMDQQDPLGHFFVVVSVVSMFLFLAFTIFAWGNLSVGD